MGHELPDLWWLLSPEFTHHIALQLNLGDKLELHNAVLDHYKDHLVAAGYLKDAKGGRKQLGNPKFDGSYISYQQQLLQMVSAAKLGDDKKLVHILIEIPQDADSFCYMQTITEITKGVLSFVNVRMTFIGFSTSTFTLDL